MFPVEKPKDNEQLGSNEHPLAPRLWSWNIISN